VARRFQRFEVIGELGKGGAGEVFLARDPQLEREVAVKVLATEPATATALATFQTVDLRGADRTELLAEARVMARMSHPNILPIYEVGVADGLVFLVMEYVDGADLRTWLREPRSNPDILAVFAQAGRGLAAAHAHGIVHRDFKPDNVLIGRDHRVRVADFGIAGLIATTSYTRLADGRGTPMYMAHELWQGAAATPRSDVFAFCRALAEAFGGHDDPAALDHRGLDPTLRALIAAGLDDDPARRPDLARLIDALEWRRGRRWPALAGGAAAIAVAATVLAMNHRSDRARGDAGASCDAGTAPLGTWWTAAARDQLRAALPPEAVDRVAPVFDAAAADLISAHRTACEARDRGDLTAKQLAVRQSCIERRAIGLAALAEAAPARHLAPSLLAEWAYTFVPAPSCADSSEPVLVDRAAVSKLWRRIAASVDLAVPCLAQPAELTRLEADADQLGESEAAATSAYLLGRCQSNRGHYDEADAADARAYDKALAIGSSTALLALVERAHNAVERGDPATAIGYTNLATSLADRLHAPPYHRTLIEWVRGAAELTREAPTEALADLRHALARIEQTGGHFPSIALGISGLLLGALEGVEGHEVECVELARKMVDRGREQLGPKDERFAVMLVELGATESEVGRAADALDHTRQGLAILTATYSADNVRVLAPRKLIAWNRLLLGEIEPAREELAALAAATEHNIFLGQEYADDLLALAEATFRSGRTDDALPMFRRAVDESIGRFGKTASPGLQARSLFAFDLIEAGHLDEADQLLGPLGEDFAASTEPHANRLAALRGQTVAALDLARGKPKEAEALARGALSALADGHAPDVMRSDVLLELGRSLIDQRRLVEARAPLEEARAIVGGLQLGADAAARIDVELARIDAGLGHAYAARARAARDALAPFPGQLVARREVAALLAGRPR